MSGTRGSVAVASFRGPRSSLNEPSSRGYNKQQYKSIRSSSRNIPNVNAPPPGTRHHGRPNPRRRCEQPPEMWRLAQRVEKTIIIIIIRPRSYSCNAAVGIYVYKSYRRGRRHDHLCKTRRRATHVRAVDSCQGLGQIPIHRINRFE